MIMGLGTYTLGFVWNWGTPNHLGKTVHTKAPMTGNVVNIPPIHADDWGMVYGILLMLPIKTPNVGSWESHRAASPTSWIPEANGSSTASIMLDVLEIGKPQKKQKNLLVFFEELNGCGISGISHLCARTAWMESETKFSWRIPISTILCIFGLKSNYMQHVGRQEGEKKADKNNFISWNEKVSSNLSMYYISLCYYIYIYITSVYIYIYITILSQKKGDHDQCHKVPAMLPRRQRAAHAALQKTCGRRVSPERNCIFLPVGQRPPARAEGDPTRHWRHWRHMVIIWLMMVNNMVIIWLIYGIIWFIINRNGVWLLISGWWFQPTPLKNDGVKVSWDDDIPNIWKVIKFMFQTTKQYENHLLHSKHTVTGRVHGSPMMGYSQ